ncbi:MAG TPA: amidohydrolase family protein [Acidimicrobiales bacterium]|nr:amidohydrolase family protein [Acidimicrobiales bacterium]
MLVNSADSHVLEPDRLWLDALPAAQRDLAPQSHLVDGAELLVIEGRQMRRTLPDVNVSMRPPGAYEPVARAKDLDADGIWGELMFPSVGMWCYLIQDPALMAACCRVYNEWVVDAFVRTSPRFRAVAMLPVIDVGAALGELSRVADAGFRAVLLPSTPPEGSHYNHPGYDPLWAALQETGIRACFHVGTGMHPVVERGAGAAVINYVETFFPPQRSLTYLVSAGVLDRYPDLHFLFIEGGASWLPSAMERMDEAYKEHGRWVKPPLSMLPSEFIRRQVHVSFQHDRAALQTLDITGLDAIMWGSDYPHLEGTWPHSREVLDDLLATVDESAREAIAGGTLARLFDIPAPVVA